ncbi:MAG: GNAT family N-acetyltransferase [Bacillota bacterium]|nr:GNAT family N-acetyltransferase [Bacillota bacterium]
MSRNLRLVTPSDAEEILNIYAPYILNTAVSFEEAVPSIGSFTQKIKDISSVYPYIVAEDDKGIAGYAYAGPHMSRAAYRWNVETSIYLDSQKRRQGLGRLLYTALFAILKLQNIENIYACITYPNPESIGFHQSMGFIEVGHFPQCGFKAEAWQDIVWLGKRLGNGSPPHGEFIPMTWLSEENIQYFLRGVK